MIEDINKKVRVYHSNFQTVDKPRFENKYIPPADVNVSTSDINVMFYTFLALVSILGLVMYFKKVRHN